MDGLHEAAFEALLRGSDDLVLIVDREGRILEAGELARARLAGGADALLPGTSLLDHLSVHSGRALLAFLDALGTDGAITLDQIEGEGAGGVGNVRSVRYAIHAIPRAGLRRDFLLIGREVREAEEPRRPPDPATIDPLTGLANRHGLADGLARLWSACESDRTLPLAWVLVVDVDHFKAWNDRLGHLAGDEVLAGIGRVLGTSVREGDVAARYGGDEFILAGRTAEPHDVQTIAERISMAIRNLEPVPSGADRPAPLTVSVGGVVVRPGPSRTPHAAIEAADRAMYRAKQAGRDRVDIEPGVIGDD